MANLFTSYRQGKSYTRQSVANMSRQRFADNHPLSYGWKAIGATRDGIVIWEEAGGAGLTRHPAGDCWLLFWMQCWQPVDLHISELSESLETLKLRIELEVYAEEFSAAVETLAA
jgi:hypothetical protein